MKKILLLLLIATYVSGQCTQETICLGDAIMDRMRYNDTTICVDCICDIYFLNNQGQKILEDDMEPLLNASDDQIGMYYYQVTYPNFQPNNKYTAYYTCVSGGYSGSGCVQFTTRDCYTEGGGSGGGGGGGGAGGDESTPGLVSYIVDVGKFLIQTLVAIPALLVFITGTLVRWLITFLNNPIGFFQDIILPGVQALIWAFFLANSLILLILEGFIVVLTVLYGGKEPIRFLKTYIEYHTKFFVWVFEKVKMLLEMGISVLNVIINIVSLIVNGVINLLGVIGNTIGEIIPG